MSCIVTVYYLSCFVIVRDVPHASSYIVIQITASRIVGLWHEFKSDGFVRRLWVDGLAGLLFADPFPPLPFGNLLPQDHDKEMGRAGDRRFHPGALQAPSGSRYLWKLYLCTATIQENKDLQQMHRFTGVLSILEGVHIEVKVGDVSQCFA